jgi:tetratricopeptide (TPR) repeat protein
MYSRRTMDAPINALRRRGMRRPRTALTSITCMTVAAAVLIAAPAADADTWVEVRTDNFTVVTDGGQGRARDVAWQFEQVRAAILAAWPWAQPRLELPVQIVAAKDEASLRRLVPKLNSDRDPITVSIVCVAPDRYSIVMRSDFKYQDSAGTINPYFTSYWNYSFLALETAFQGRLPRWFVHGLVELLSNTLVASDHIDFGRGHPGTVSTLRNEPRQRLAELFAVTASSDYLKDGINRNRFDAQSFGVVHYLLFGVGKQHAGAVDAIAKRLLDGETSAEAVAAVFGSVEALENAYLESARRPITQFMRVKIDARIPRSFPVRTLTDAEASIVRAGIHGAYGRTDDAEKLVLEARRTEPGAPASFVMEGLLHDQSKKAKEASAAYARAVELGSENFYAFYRVAVDLRDSADSVRRAQAESHVARALALNPSHGPSYSLHGVLLAHGPDPEKGLAPARRGVELDSTRSDARLALATVLWRMDRKQEALGQALAGRSLARTDEQRAGAQRVIDAIGAAQAGQ